MDIYRNKTVQLKSRKSKEVMKHGLSETLVNVCLAEIVNV